MENNHSLVEKQIEKRIESGIHTFFHILFHVLFGAAVLALFGYVVMLLWNWLIPDVIGWNTVNYWQSLGLLALARILLGGMCGKHFWKMKMRHHHNPIRDKWMQMTPEERKEFMKKRHFHPGFGPDFFCREEKPEKQD